MERDRRRHIAQRCRAMAFGRAAALRLCAMCLFATAAAAQDEVQLASEVVVVPLAVRATDGSGVSKLTAEDFAISDEGVTPEIAFFQKDVAPADVALLVDTSASTGATLDV